MDPYYLVVQAILLVHVDLSDPALYLPDPVVLATQMDLLDLSDPALCRPDL